MKHTISLLELNRLVRDTIELSLPDAYWVEAELADVRESAGHCYMELVQKDEFGSTPVARASAKCWRNTWMLVRPHFERVTGERLHAGMKVLLQVHAQFHENYGFSWIVSDIDPTFTLGDMARKRMEIVRKLKEEGVFDLNRELSIPLFAQRIAVISSATAAGYGDFCSQLKNNIYGFDFIVELFSAVMQGEQVEQSVIAALNRINECAELFDCVVIIRGGGATSDLSGFDTLSLAENVANFPLPVITGIGHERDESVLDMVANTRVKTPTAAAAFLIDNLKHVLDRINTAQDRITSAVRRRIDYESMRIGRIAVSIPSLSSLVITKRQSALSSLYSRLCAAASSGLALRRSRLESIGASLAPLASRRILVESHRVQLLEQRAAASDPALLLRRGYSITLHNGHAVTDASVLDEGDVIETRFASGSAVSVVSSSASAKPSDAHTSGDEIRK
ncbi:exodeoxyribonuclease VII large subunit [Prevotella sp.]|uniref:exodeoxyribonuclease VII large subunit n=1 Tax=Prevotella sp. TaxID=59823 RepID=UPI003AB51E0F